MGCSVGVQRERYVALGPRVLAGTVPASAARGACGPSDLEAGQPCDKL